MADEFYTTIGGKLGILDAGHDLDAEHGYGGLQTEEIGEWRLQAVQAEDAFAVDAPGWVGIGGGRVGQLSCGEFCRPIGQTGLHMVR
jgi:hypothetical protein